MINKIFGAVFAPKYPRGYTGRHRAAFGRSRAPVARPARVAPVVTG